jgi:hypothetical protein
MERPRFNLRLTPELEALVIEASRRNGRSKNAEILTALEWRYKPDAALQVAEAMRPLLESLDEKQRATFVELVSAMAGKPAAKGRRSSP